MIIGIGKGIISITGKIDDSFDKIAKSLEKKFSTTGKGLGASIANGIANGLMASGTLLAGATTFVTKKAADLQKEMSIVRSLAWNKDKKQMEKDIQGVFEFATKAAKTTPFSRIQNLQVSQELLRLGLTGEEIGKSVSLC